jgi:hypothetical protein
MKHIYLMTASDFVINCKEYYEPFETSPDSLLKKVLVPPSWNSGKLLCVNSCHSVVYN